MANIVTAPAHSVDELFEHLNPLNIRWTDGNWIFRGQGHAGWKMLPSAFRDDWNPWRSENITGGIGSVLSQMAFEWEMLSRFLEQVNKSGLRFASGNESVISTEALRQNFVQFMDQHRDSVDDPSEWPPEELLPNLALAQHYGIPTRLLDWTESTYVAAYFAAVKAARFEKNIDKRPDGWTDFSIWALNLEKLHALKIMDKTFAKVVTVPSAANSNLHAQAGLFVYYGMNTPVQSRDDFVPLPFEAVAESVLEELTRLGAKGGLLSSATLIRIDVPGNLAGEVLRALSLFGVSASRLFPGYDGAAKAVLEKYLW